MNAYNIERIEPTDPKYFEKMGALNYERFQAIKKDRERNSVSKLGRIRLPPLGELRASFKVDSESPSGLSRIKSTRGRGGAVGPCVSKCPKGHWTISIKGVTYQTARIVFFLYHCVDPKNKVVVFRNGNREDCSPGNLEVVANQDIYDFYQKVKQPH